MRKLKKTEGYEDLDIKGKYGYPYLICINRAGNTVTVYCIDEEGNYTRPYLSMVCSAGMQHRAASSKPRNATVGTPLWVPATGSM